MDDPADAVEKIKPHQNLAGYLLHHLQRKTFVVISFEYFQKIDPQYFKNHTKMITIGTLIEERVKEV